MAGLFAFRCSCCGEMHEEFPGFGFDAPAPFLEQPQSVQDAGKLSSDICHYTDEEGTRHFIRVCLEVPIESHEDPFIWGVWVSLSKESFEHYVATYDDPDPSVSYFGWFCNYLPGYPNTYALKTRVHPRGDNQRPYIVLEKTDHPLCVDFHQGISITRAQELAESILHNQ